MWKTDLEKEEVHTQVGSRWKEIVPTQMNKPLIVFSQTPPAFISQPLSYPAAASMQGPAFLQLPPKWQPGLSPISFTTSSL